MFSIYILDRFSSVHMFSELNIEISFEFQTLQLKNKKNLI